jgi:exopolysaccharide production protein ExoQ
MPSGLALLLNFALIFYLFRWDRKKHPQQPTGAMWVPLLWVLIIASRFVSEWLSGTSASMSSGGGYEEGSPIDRIIFFGLIILGTLILISRKVKVGQILSENKGLVIFLGFSLLSLAWSDYSFVAFKRWIKVLGHPIMVLVLLTEPQPAESMKALLRRTAYVLITLSVTLIKYVPELGRGFSGWTGAGLNTGVTTNKNALSCLCLVVGLFLVWTLLMRLKEKPANGGVMVPLSLLGATLWLLNGAESSTGLVCFIVGTAVLVLLHSRSLQLEKRAFGAYLVVTLLFVGSLYLAGVNKMVIEALGEDSTLTGRTEVWDDVMALHDSPILGAGFESFWLGPRIAFLWDKYWWHPNQAHNGYIETYINLGAAGLVVFAIAIFSSYRKIRVAYGRSIPLASLWFTYLVVMLLYNFTEATFKALHLLFFLFFLVSVEYSHKKDVSSQNPVSSGTFRSTTIVRGSARRGLLGKSRESAA